MKHKPNYELKAKAIEEGYDVLERRLSKAMFRYFAASINEVDNGEPISENVKEAYQEAVHYNRILANNELYQEAKKINQQARQKRNRLEKTIARWLTNYDCIFLTLTFTDKTLEKTTKETRRRYVTRALKRMSDKYIANIDYGKENEREHYHAIVVCDNVDRKKWSRYGAINFERIKATSDSVKLAKYIVKLTNHAIKETVKQNRVIYSKN